MLMSYNPQHPQLIHVGCDIVICFEDFKLKKKHKNSHMTIFQDFMFRIEVSQSILALFIGNHTLVFGSDSLVTCPKVLFCCQYVLNCPLLAPFVLNFTWRNFFYCKICYRVGLFYFVFLKLDFKESSSTLSLGCE